jgi:hypothetical protein
MTAGDAGLTLGGRLARMDMPSAGIENLLMIIADELNIARVDRESEVARDVLSRETIAECINKMRDDLGF